MNFDFSDTSDVTVVITSCGRFKLLKETIDSFLQFNTYPIKKIIITEDSGNAEIYDCIPSEIKNNTEVILNKNKLGQIKSIDLAYSKVDSNYIFHCEDDWKFYRSRFIEDSKKILEISPSTLQVWLRSFYHDIQIHSPYHFLGSIKSIDNINYYTIHSKKKEWQGFSFNPGLRRLSDYKLIKSYSSFPSEKLLSQHYASLGYTAAILENDAVLHTGFDEHIENSREKTKKKRKKIRYFSTLSLIAFVFFTIGYISS